jgi:hypothetical protein
VAVADRATPFDFAYLSHALAGISTYSAFLDAR